MKNYRVILIEKNTIELYGNGCTIYMPIKKFMSNYGNPKIDMIIKK